MDAKNSESYILVLGRLQKQSQVWAVINTFLCVWKEWEPSKEFGVGGGDTVDDSKEFAHVLLDSLSLEF